MSFTSRNLLYLIFHPVNRDYLACFPVEFTCRNWIDYPRKQAIWKQLHEPGWSCLAGAFWGKPGCVGPCPVGRCGAVRCLRPLLDASPSPPHTMVGETPGAGCQDQKVPKIWRSPGVNALGLGWGSSLGAPPVACVVLGSGLCQRLQPFACSLAVSPVAQSILRSPQLI